jgi:hypothetical protein
MGRHNGSHEEIMSEIESRASIIRGPSAATLLAWASRVLWFVVIPFLPIWVLVLVLTQTGLTQLFPVFYGVLGFWLLAVLVTVLLNSVLSAVRENQEVRLGYTSTSNRHLELPQVAPDTGIVIREPGGAMLHRDEYRLAVAAANAEWMIVVAEMK